MTRTPLSWYSWTSVRTIALPRQRHKDKKWHLAPLFLLLSPPFHISTPRTSLPSHPFHISTLRTYLTLPTPLISLPFALSQPSHPFYKCTLLIFLTLLTPLPIIMVLHLLALRPLLSPALSSPLPQALLNKLQSSKNTTTGRSPVTRHNILTKGWEGIIIANWIS